VVERSAAKVVSIDVGGCSFSFGPKPLRDALRIVKQLGFDVVDLGICPGNTQIHPVVAAMEPEHRAAEATELLQNFGLRPEECFVLDFGEPINHPSPHVRDQTRHLFRGITRFASLTRCRSIMLIPGIVHSEIAYEESFDLAVKELRELVKISQDAGIQLNVEPCEPSIAENPRDAVRLCEEVSGLGLTLDYSHFIDPGYSQASVEPLHRFATHFHARQAAPGKRVAAVERGVIDFKRVITLAKQQNYKGVMAVEYVDCEVTTNCGVDVMKETIKMKDELAQLLI
jgi:sugar phosphate isomerase/epimerase